MVLHCMISLQISHQWLRLLTNPQPLCVTYHKAVMSVYAVSCFLTEQRHFWNINSLIKIFWISCLHMEKYDLWSTINVQFYFSGFARNLRSRKPNKAQTKRENIMGVQFLHAYYQMVSNSYFILYPIFILLPHYCQPTYLSPPHPLPS